MVLGCYYMTGTGRTARQGPVSFAETPNRGVAGSYAARSSGLHAQVKVRPGLPTFVVHESGTRRAVEQHQLVETTVGRIIFNECCRKQILLQRTSRWTRRTAADRWPSALQVLRSPGARRRLADDDQELGFHYATQVRRHHRHQRDQGAGRRRRHPRGGRRAKSRDLRRAVPEGLITEQERYKPGSRDLERRDRGGHGRASRSG